MRSKEGAALLFLVCLINFFHFFTESVQTCSDVAREYIHNCKRLKKKQPTLLTCLVFLNIPKCGKRKKGSSQAFLTRFRVRTRIASCGLPSAVLGLGRPGVPGSPPALMWRMLSCHLSAFKAFRRRGPPGPPHALCARQSEGSPPPPPPPSQRSTL